MCLCVLGYLPGLIHSWYIISKYYPSISEYEDLEAGTAFIVGSNRVIAREPIHNNRQPQYGSVAVNQPQYGSVGNTAQSQIAQASSSNNAVQPLDQSVMVGPPPVYKEIE